MAEDPAEHYSRNPEAYEEETRLEKLPEEFHRLLEKFCEKVGDGKILDAGCGPGRDTEFFTEKGFDVVGVDIAKGAIEYARRNKKGSYKVMDLRDLEFDRDSFDGVWCCASIFFVPPEDMKQIASEINRVLKEGGEAYFAFKIGEENWVKEEWGGEIRQYRVTVEEAKDLLTGAGFKIQHSSINESKEGRTFGNFFCKKT